MYAYITEWMTKRERDDFDRKLNASDATGASRGTKDLLAVMGVRFPTPGGAD
jgi:hypothetical protein